jgi:hypothetical protein
MAEEELFDRREEYERGWEKKCGTSITSGHEALSAEQVAQSTKLMHRNRRDVSQKKSTCPF